MEKSGREIGSSVAVMRRTGTVILTAVAGMATLGSAD
jgi:hypothetical protein